MAAFEVRWFRRRDRTLVAAKSQAMADRFTKLGLKPVKTYLAEKEISSGRQQKLLDRLRLQSYAVDEVERRRHRAEVAARRAAAAAQLVAEAKLHTQAPTAPQPTEQGDKVAEQERPPK